MKNYIYLFVALIGCANILPPSGGERDITAPVFIKSSPENFSINFNSNNIVLYFDEYINLKNIDNIRITPSCLPKPVITRKNKSVIVNLNCDLKKNTTYTITFNNSIIDLNEGNEVKNLKYVFSTGNIIDSCYLTGNVSDFLFAEKQSNCVVSLFNEYDSTTSLQYYGLTDENGEYIIENIKDTIYTIFAFCDNNNNFDYDLGELVSKKTPVIALNKEIDLKVFQENLNPIKIYESRHKNLIHFEHDLLTKPIEILNCDGFWLRKKYESIFWFNDSIKLIHFRHRNFYDSIRVNNRIKHNKFDFEIISKNEEIINDNRIIISSNLPLNKFDSDKIFINNEKVKIKILDPFHLELSPDFIVKEKVSVTMLDSAVTNKFYQSNDSTKLFFDFSDANFGSLTVTSENYYENSILELFQNSKTINVLDFNKKQSLVNLKPGKYQLRVYQDNNQNRIWDHGGFNFLNNTEKIQVFPEIIDIKANWTFEAKLKNNPKKH